MHETTRELDGPRDEEPRSHPPPARLAFRVGVVGHRPNRLKEADLRTLAGVIRGILIDVREQVEQTAGHHGDVFAPGAPILRAVSPLAEGTDRIFAEQAISLGYELCCVMPFPQAEFEKDFAPDKALEPDSVRRFRGLLARAENQTRLTRFELDGSRADEVAAYATGGRVVLNQSDLLVVVWDGERRGKRGGTEETFADAQHSGVPVVWIDAHAPHRWQIVDARRRLSPSRQATADELRSTVQELLDIPTDSAAPAHGHQGKKPHRESRAVRDRLLRFYREVRPPWQIAIVWKIFQTVLGDTRWPKLSIAVPDFEQAVQDEWPDADASPVGSLVGQLRPYYAWADKLAVIFANRYRSAFILSFLLATVAVGMALLPVGLELEEHSRNEYLCIAAELIAIVAVLALVICGRAFRWHERWLDYRLVAELVRHARMMAPLGGGRPFPQVPAHWSAYGQPGATWMAWYVRSAERALGLPTIVVDRNHLLTCLDQLHDLVKGQASYHHTNAARCHKIEHRLHITGIVLMILTLAACCLHLYPELAESMHLEHWLPPHTLTFACGFFPALGAALAAINNQGEFRRVGRRSQAMEQQLHPHVDPKLKEIPEALQRLIETSFLARIDRLRDRVGAAQPALAAGTPQLSVQAAGLAGEVARLLVNEVLDWRVVFLDRPLNPPA